MLLSFVFMAFKCSKDDEDNHSTITMINNSEKEIYTYFGGSYPDTLQDVGVPSSSEPSIYKVASHERNATALWMSPSWEIVLCDRRQIPSDTLMVFVYDAELLDSKTSNVYDAVIQRYDLSLQDLQQLNWTLTYPPSSDMRNIKMYPPYGE